MGGVLGVGESQSSKPTLWFSTLMRQGYMVVETLQDSVKGQLVRRQECRRKNGSAWVIGHSLACSNIGQHIVKSCAVLLMRSLNCPIVYKLLNIFRITNCSARTTSFLNILFSYLTIWHLVNEEIVQQTVIRDESKSWATAPVPALPWAADIGPGKGVSPSAWRKNPSEVELPGHWTICWPGWNEIRGRNLDSYVKSWEEKIEERNYSFS